MPAVRIRHRRPVDTSWHADAACRGETPAVFFGPHNESEADREIREVDAKVICHFCPVRSECLDYAITRPEKYGIWGGLNEDERERERRRRRRAARAA